MDSILNKNTLMHAIQCVSAISRMLEEHIHEGNASDDEKFSLGEFIMDLDSALDNLSTVYQEQRGNDARYPDLEILETALSEFKIISAACKKTS